MNSETVSICGVPETMLQTMYARAEFTAFIARYGFEVIHQEMLGGSLASLSYLAARKKE